MKNPTSLISLLQTLDVIYLLFFSIVILLGWLYLENICEYQRLSHYLSILKPNTMNMWFQQIGYTCPVIEYVLTVWPYLYVCIYISQRGLKFAEHNKLNFELWRLQNYSKSQRFVPISKFSSSEYSVENQQVGFLYIYFVRAELKAFLVIAEYQRN